MSGKLKHSFDFKVAIVKQILERDRSMRSISADKGIDYRMVKRWVQFYNRFGEAGLVPQCNAYSLDFKLKIINYYKDNNLSLGKACLQFGIRCTNVLRKWINIYEQEGIEGLEIERRGRKELMASKNSSKPTSRPLTDHEKILEENRLLRAEIDFLKKLRALIQKEEEEKRRKR